MAVKKSIKSNKKTVSKTAAKNKKSDLLFETDIIEDKKLGKSPTEIVHLIKYLETEKVDEFEYSDGDFSIFVKRDDEPQIKGDDIYKQEQLLSILLNAEKKNAHHGHTSEINAASVSPTSEKAEKKAADDEEGKYQFIESPIAGTFYEAPSPSSTPYVKTGQKIEKGQVVCIVEAMKLMNEIKSDFAGTVHKICVKNGEMLQAKQKLFYIIPE